MICGIAGFMARGLRAAISSLNPKHLMSRFRRWSTPGDEYIVVPEDDYQSEDIPDRPANQDKPPEGAERPEEHERLLSRQKCKKLYLQQISI
jgi:hypothetical protein